jgi:EAL domain-containing protein (putative c-di-GMP-specific phosphodiesterase class I)
MRDAEVAMYRAKELGRNTFQFYSADMGTRASDDLALENDLRHAIERDELVLNYQPLVEARTGRILGLEALVRWRHRERGLISPAQFIPLAEESGLIVPIGEWVLRTACAQCQLWRSNGLPHLKVAVNLSARQFREHGLDEMVTRIMQEVGLEPEALELELTESIIMQSSHDTLAVMQRLSELGVTFSIDDFGTGYSNLAYLKRFPVDVLKVDRSFVKDIPDDLDDAAIADAIITMAHSLGMQVIAEGVETEQQRVFMRSHGCDAMQGFFFSRPLPVEEVSQLLKHQSPLPLTKKSA